MGRRLSCVYQCPECLQSYRPHHVEQQTCSITCGAIRRARRHPQTADMRRAWAATQARAQAKRAQALRGLSPDEIWRLGRRTGYLAGWAAGRRWNAGQPTPKYSGAAYVDGLYLRRRKGVA